MGTEDHRRFFIVASVILEIVTPLFRNKLEHVLTHLRFPSLQDFLDSQPIKHIMFLLHVKNAWCCVDRANCVSRGTLPFILSQWDLFYSENPGPGRHHCHCKYTANHIPVSDLDITLTSLILMNCGNLGTGDINVIKELRKLKNNYLSHNTTGGLNDAEFITVWTDLTTFVLQLDHTKQDDLVRIERRPFDEDMSNNYTRCVLDVFKRLDEIDTKLDTRFDRQDALLDTRFDRQETRLDTRFDRQCTQLDTRFDRIEEMLRNVTGQMSETCSVQQGPSQSLQKKPYKFGQSIFKLSHQLDLTSIFHDTALQKYHIHGAVMTDDGRIVLSIFSRNQLLVCNIDGSHADSYILQSFPGNVTSVNDSTVAVTLPSMSCIKLYDINNKLKLQTIQTGVRCSSITNKNNKLAVGGEGKLLIIDPQTGNIIQTTNTDMDYTILYASSDIIFCCNYFTETLDCYNYSGDKLFSRKLPSTPVGITSLQDGSMYVMCYDGSVYHVSLDGEHKVVTTKGLKSEGGLNGISYNPTQRKLCIANRGIVKVFHEI